jgi:hypothetical protein
MNKLRDSIYLFVWKKIQELITIKLLTEIRLIKPLTATCIVDNNFHTRVIILPLWGQYCVDVEVKKARVVMIT